MSGNCWVIHMRHWRPFCMTRISVKLQKRDRRPAVLRGQGEQPGLILYYLLCKFWCKVADNRAPSCRSTMRSLKFSGTAKVPDVIVAILGLESRGSSHHWAPISIWSHGAGRHWARRGFRWSCASRDSYNPDSLDSSIAKWSQKTVADPPKPVYCSSKFDQNSANFR